MAQSEPRVLPPLHDAAQGVLGAPGKRRRAAFAANGIGAGYIFGFHFNSLVFAWEFKAPLKFDEVYFVDEEQGADTENVLHWLEDGAESGDSLFLFIVAHGNNGGAGSFSRGRLGDWCRTLKSGVNVFIATCGCGIAFLAELPYHYHVAEDDDDSGAPLVDYSSACDNCRTRKGGPPLANVVTLTDHPEGVMGGASCDHSRREQTGQELPTQTAPILRYIQLESVSANVGQTWDAFLRDYSDYESLPTLGVSRPELLDSANFLFV